MAARLWDLPVRLFHWTLVVMVLLLWITGEFGGLDVTLPIPGKGDVYFANMDVHALLGQGVLVLVIFRLLWGVWGSTSARFVHFVKAPAKVVAEVRSLLGGGLPDHQGHNPLGALMVVALLLLLLAQAGTGLFSADDFFFAGPLAELVDDDWVETLTGLHESLFTALQVFILTHVAAVFYYLARGSNLIRPMLTGTKPGITGGLRFAPLWLALATFALAFVGVFWLVNR